MLYIVLISCPFRIGLTNLDIADIFLTVTALTDFSPELGRFDYKQFCEVSLITSDIFNEDLYLCVFRLWFGAH